ncbi:MAG: diguanylate cyclase [Desulfamplus sp.]|nr:diguanylate cyclase [Desulfamplus sp.]
MFKRGGHGCRYGGEEFAVILSNTSAQDGFIVAERIRNKFVHIYLS